jgi:hypothetical protein
MDWQIQVPRRELKPAAAKPSAVSVRKTRKPGVSGKQLHVS